MDARRWVYLLLLTALSVPLLCGYSVKPARLAAAQQMFEIIENVQVAPGDIAFVAFDFGPNSKAENESQAQIVVEHLMRRRIPIAVFSQVPIAEPFLSSVPEMAADKLMREYPGERWQYGRDWINLGFRPGTNVIIQAISKSQNIVELFKRDARGNNLADLPAFSGVRRLENIRLLAQFTSLVGTFESYVQFFQKRDYRPVFLHGCTSITIPKAYIYIDSGQLQGLLEGIAGASWYSTLLSERYPTRGVDTFLVTNTGLGIAQLLIVALIIAGNLAALFGRAKEGA